MYVTVHATDRMGDRLGWELTDLLQAELEARTGEVGTVAYLLGSIAGEVIVAVAVDGSVETVYFRRETQDLTPVWFGASKVVDLRIVTTGMDSPEYERAYERSQALDRELTRAERREARSNNGRKMVVTNRSALMLGRLIREQKMRRRVGRRKVGGR